MALCIMRYRRYAYALLAMHYAFIHYSTSHAPRPRPTLHSALCALARSACVTCDVGRMWDVECGMSMWNVGYV
jgi:hypothetical protein